MDSKEAYDLTTKIILPSFVGKHTKQLFFIAHHLAFCLTYWQTDGLPQQDSFSFFLKYV